MSSRVKIEDFNSLASGVTLTNSTVDTDYVFQTEGLPAPFVPHDLLITQQYNPKGDTVIRQSVVEVIEVNGAVVHFNVISETGDITPGDTFVRIAHPDGANLMKFNVNGAYTPFIAMMQDVTDYDDYLDPTKEVVRLGELGGITSPRWGVLSGPGLYAKTVYLENANIKGVLETEDGKVVSTEFSVLSGEITAKVSTSTFSLLEGRMSTAESSISVNEANISLKVSTSDFSLLEGRVSTAESAILLNESAILLKVSTSTFSLLEGRMSTAESSISLNEANINLRVSKDDVINQINISTEGITISANKITTSDITSLGVVTAAQFNLGSGRFTVDSSGNVNIKAGYSSSRAIIGAAAFYDQYSDTSRVGIAEFVAAGGISYSISSALQLEAYGATNAYGADINVHGGGGDNHAVKAIAHGTGTNYGIYAQAYGGSTNYAGYFNGKVQIVGDLIVTGKIIAASLPTTETGQVSGTFWRNTNDVRIKE